MKQSEKLGTEEIPKLLFQMAVPASVGIMVMSIYMIVDTIFIGQFVGAMGIAAITVVLPINFLIASVGMSIGIGGSSVISRALGAGDRQHAFQTFGNQITLTILVSTLVIFGGSFFQEEILKLFGGNGPILQPAKDYFGILLYGIPFLAWAMMSNNVVRAEGRPKIAMNIMLIPAIVNLVLDPIFIVWLDMGIQGAAWATVISYIFSATFAAWFFFFGGSELKIKLSDLVLKLEIVKEIFAIGIVSLARQGTISLLSIVLNNSLYAYGGAFSVSIYGIINRMMMFANFPVSGITHGFLPIAGFNYGAGKMGRVKEVIRVSLKVGTGLAVVIFIALMVFAPQIASVFTNDSELIAKTAPALRICFMATPLIVFQLISSAYFQAIGKAVPALLLTLTKQGFFLIPLVLLMPFWFGLEGIWYSFPIADVLAAGVCYWWLRRKVSL